MVHTFSLLGQNIALDIHSGSVHLCDDVSLKAINLYEKQSRNEVEKTLLEEFQNHTKVSRLEINKILNQLDMLKEQGKLYSIDDYCDKLLIESQKRVPVKALCLHVAHICNLACSYCFAGQGKYRGKASLMSLETGKQALDFLINNSSTRKYLEVDFFGGEPLLNWGVIKELVQYGRELEKYNNKRFRFTLTTNGVLMDDEVIAFCLQEMENVVLSLDGRKEVHDHFRVDRQNKGSYDLIVPKFQEFVNKRKDQEYYIRGTYTRYNLDFLQDILHMVDLGFTRISMEPVVAPQGDSSALREEDLPIIFEQYEKLAQIMIDRKRQGKGFEFYHYMIDLENGPCIHKRFHGCGSGTEYLAVTPEGDLYPCHQFVGETNYLLGNLSVGITNGELQNQFTKNTLYSREECKNCWAKFYCAGGCVANASHSMGNIHGVYDFGCKLFRKRIECALAFQAALLEE